MAGGGETGRYNYIGSLEAVTGSRGVEGTRKRSLERVLS